MVDRLATGAAWLNGRLKAVAAVAARLRRTDGVTYDITATPGQSVFESGTYDDGSTVRIESRDFVVDLVELEGYLPRPGDAVEVDGMAAEFEVFAPDGDHAWRYSSPAEVSIRIHTRRVNTST